ncbi:MAG: hypothetical protein JZU65_22410 [Chlorobium sp.]|nr:hypothetical protein [Chlorobium sp.]
MKKLILLLLAMLLFASCEYSFVDDGIKKYNEIPREWTFVVYMAAENDLEAAAIADFNELESVDFSGGSVTILVLLDRIDGYDATNGNWTDTRLYRVNTDPNGNNATIISERLSSDELGLSVDEDTELNMASPLVLSQLLSYAQNEQPADNYGLILWGHGTGWRGDESASELYSGTTKAFAFDDSTGQYMTVQALGSAVDNKNLAVIGIDTCFGALIETAYELRDSAPYMVASEGITPSNGWDYSSLFTTFVSSTRTASVFCDAAITQFSSQYNGTPNATISKIDLTTMSELKTALDSFLSPLSTYITTSSARNVVLDAMLNTIDSYHYSTYPCDLFLDLSSFTDQMISLRTSITADAGEQGSILSLGNALHTAISNSVIDSWSVSTGNTERQLGIYATVLDAAGVPATTHSAAYIHNSGSIDSSDFVSASGNWVPNSTPQANSFLDKIFYWVY